YDITGANEQDPVKVGYWNIDEVRPSIDGGMRCTAHVFDIHQKEGIMTIAFYNGGVRVVDLKGLVGVSLGETQLSGGMKQIGFYQFSDSDSWAAKTPKIARDGDFFLYGNDLSRGMDIYHFDAGGEKSKNKGRFMSPTEAELYLSKNVGEIPADYEMVCLIPQR
nr:hypothetical protein [Actinomycetota bacterium]